MGKLLDPQDILAGLERYEQACLAIRHLNDGGKRGTTITMPKPPSTVTESMVGHLVWKGLLYPGMDVVSVEVGGGADVRVFTSMGPALGIEVKTTGEREFTRFSAVDAAASHLVWLDLADLWNIRAVEIDPAQAKVVAGQEAYFSMFVTEHGLNPRVFTKALLQSSGVLPV